MINKYVCVMMVYQHKWGILCLCEDKVSMGWKEAFILCKIFVEFMNFLNIEMLILENFSLNVLNDFKQKPFKYISI